MKNTLFCLFIFLSSLSITKAQSFPSYTINTCTSASAGYYFLDAIDLNQSNTYSPTQMILDSLGRTIYYNVITAGGGGDFKLQPNGLISYLYHTKFYLMDSTFTIVDSVVCRNGISTDGHDLQILPNGHFLLIGYENVTMNLSSYVMFGPNHTIAGGSNANVKCGVIQEQDANHNVVFEWHAKDHFAFADVDPRYMSSPSNVDWNHMNAVELDTDGNILLSSRYFNEITKINRSDSSIIWRLGGNANQFTFTNDPTQFKGQHDIRRISNGNITLFDNGIFGPPVHIASGKEYQLDENLMTATLVWSHVENPTHYSQAVGNTERLANGNTLIDYGITPFENRLFDVVDPSGNLVFQIQFADTLRSYRAFNYLTMPWKFPRPEISCLTIGNQTYLDAGSGYGSYLWSNGDTTQLMAITTADTFSVWVPIGAGGFIRSDFFIVPNVNFTCGPLQVLEQPPISNLTISPNPANSNLVIQSNFNEHEKVIVAIFDFTGKLVFKNEIIPNENQIILSVANLPEGIYLLQVNGNVKKFVKN